MMYEKIKVNFMRFFPFLAPTLIFLLTACALEADKEKPNIVLIMADDMGYSDIGSYGGEIQTPALDALAENGLRFTDFHNAARCCPTRASLLTGLYPHQAGVGLMVYRNYGGSYQGFLNNQSVALAEVLKEAGYKTLMSGKWHVGHQKGQWPTDRGFDRFYGIHIHVDSYWKVLDGCDVYLDDQLVIPDTSDPINHLFPEKDWYSTDAFTDYALHFLDEEVRKQENDQPFFLYLAYNSPHWPLEAPDEDIEKYRGRYMEGWDVLRQAKFNRMKNIGILSEHAVLSHSDAPPWDSISSRDRRELDFRRAMYAAQIDRMDQNIGRLVDYLKSIGEYENTLILFLSDNGCSAEPETELFGYKWGVNTSDNYAEWKEESGRSSSQGLAWANFSNIPFRKYKKWAHEGGTATPLIAHWPEKIVGAGRLAPQTGHVIDIMATLVDIADGSYPVTYQGQQIIPLEGRSLLPYFLNRERSPHPYLYWEHLGNRAIRKGDWKLVALSQGEWELYNLNEDPTESKDLVDQKPELVKELTAVYQAWAEKNGVRKWPLEGK